MNDINPNTLDITEMWANTATTETDLVLLWYVMIRKDRNGKRLGGVILNFKKSLKVFELQLRNNATLDETM